MECLERLFQGLDIIAHELLVEDLLSILPVDPLQLSTGLVKLSGTGTADLTIAIGNALRHQVGRVSGAGSDKASLGGGQEEDLTLAVRTLTQAATHGGEDGQGAENGEEEGNEVHGCDG